MLTDQFDLTPNRRELEGPSSLIRIRIITKLIHKYQLKGNVIDIGCRTGALVKELDKYFKSVVGIDVSRDALNEARMNVPSGRFFVADITDLSSLPKMLFDVAICSDVLEHIKEDVKALQNINQILRHKGYLVMTSPFSMKNWTRHDDWAQHVRRYDPDELKKKLNQSGYDVKEMFTWGYPMYSAYYKMFLQNMDPQKAKGWRRHRSPLKETTSQLLNNLFMLDDLFVWTNRGRRLFAVAMRTSGT